MDEQLMTTKEVAEELGVTMQAISVMIRRGKLSAIKLGRDWLIKPEDVDRVRDRKRGRPRKVAP